jgi:hypothetical protein
MLRVSKLRRSNSRNLAATMRQAVEVLEARLTGDESP